MPIQIGTQLGSHEITALLGKGGMGEVYRARDTRLKRDVAIKILPDEFTRDPDRVGRFQREAELLASLNHPNIAAIHSLEEAGGSRYLVLELVEGETLDEKLRRGPLPVEEALNIAKSICEALEGAHEKGVVHRDLKPANVKITPDGKVKVLDFGLAKAMESAPGNTALSNSPTLVNSFAATNAGVIIGTAAYMSPEQARGFAADQRSDIFSFGCVLYEMLSGRRAFEGETASDILASVLAREVDFTLLPQDLNPRFIELLRRCLNKNRKQRWHCASDLRAELEPIAASPRGVRVPEIPALRPRPLWRRAFPLVATAILVAAVTGFIALELRPSRPLQVTRFPITLPPDQRLLLAANSIGVSSDGSQVAYSADGKLYLRSMAQLESKAIAGAESKGFALLNPVFSPDGRSIVFTAAESLLDSAIKKVDLSGGPPVTLYRGVVSIGLQWDESGIVFSEYTAVSSHRILRVSPNGGQPEVLATGANGELLSDAQLLPGGKAVLYTASRDTSDEKSRIKVRQLRSAESKTLVEQASAARYVSTGHLLYTTGSTLMAARFDLNKLEVAGGATPVVEGVMRSSVMAFFDVSKSGSLIYVLGSAASSTSRLPIALVNRSGEAKRLDLPVGVYSSPRVSPDGKRIAFATDDDKEAIVWIYDLSGGASMRRLTFGGANRNPVWSPDGQRVAFQSDREGDLGIFMQRADGTGAVERLTTAQKGIAHIPSAWSPDGRWLSFTVSRSDGTAGAWLVSLQDKKATSFAEASGAYIANMVFSPDGKWVAYQSTETKRSEIFVQPFPATGTKYEITRGTDSHHPLWSPDGKQLFCIPGPGQFSKIDISMRPNFSFGNPSPAVTGVFLQEGGPLVPRNYDITPDGKQFIGMLVAVLPQSGNLTSPPIQVVLNWYEELKQRVPVR